MKVEKFEIDGLLLLKPKVFTDERGYFLESFNQNSFYEATGLEFNFVQDNESKSNKGVVRGLHLQLPPYEQGKLVRVVKGKVIDVAVDLRKNSPTYGKYQSVVLSGENKHQFFIPPGFGHGFSVLEDDTIFSYKCTQFYNRENEIVVQWDDPDLQIEWGVENPILSVKDLKNNLSFNRFKSPF